MKDLAEHPPEGYACIYQDIEGVKSRDEFYKRLFGLILHCVHQSPLRTATAFVARCLKKYSIQEITISGIKFNEAASAPIDYEDEVRKLIRELKSESLRTIIFLDEFAEVIHKLNRQGKAQDAVDILHTLREIRADDNFKQFTIVYAGSVGLEFVIRSIDRPKLINDLHRIRTGALVGDETDTLIAQLTEGATIQFSAGMVGYLKKKIEHQLPYYVQLMVDEIDKVAYTAGIPKINKKIIDQAFENVKKAHHHFSDWIERLKRYQPSYFAFINHILMHAAHRGQISIQEVYDIARRSDYTRTDDYMEFVEQLVSEGYLFENGTGCYRFVSPFLKAFWLKSYPIYHG